MIKLVLPNLKDIVLKHKSIVITVLLTSLGIGLLLVFLYFKNSNSQKVLGGSSESKEKQVQNIIDKVGQLIQLPKSEKPTVATVSDITKLADQPFFANAKNGDQVLIYSVAKKAVLYRPSENKIIEVAPINLGLSSPNSESATAKVSPTVVQAQYKVEVLNGTLTPGLATQTQQKIESNLSNYNVTVKADASKSDYSETIVVNVSGVSKSAAEKLAGVLNANVQSLPDGETVKSGVDLLVILGSSN